MKNTIRFISLAFASVTLAGALAIASLPAHAGPDLNRVLSSSLGRFLLLETSNGKQLIRTALGRPLRHGEGLEALSARLAEAGAAEASAHIETRLRIIEREFAHEFPGAVAAAVELSTEQRALLRFLSHSRLGGEVLEGTAGAHTYEANRQIFSESVKLAIGAPKPRFPAGVNRWLHPDWIIQFGFESEYTLRELDGLVTVYGPAPEFGISSIQWSQMPVAERSAWVNANIAKLFPNTREMGGMIKLSNEPSLAFLPEKLLRDSTGNLEIVMSPCNTFEEWQRRIFLLNERFGAGSMQGTISVPNDVFFGRSAPEAAAKMIEANMGFFSFHNDLDTLLKLETGAQRYREDPTRAAANSFNHPFLGPMTGLKHARLSRMLEANARGEMLDADTLRAVSAEDSSFKYVGGTAYRPDIVRGRVVLEVRDAHTNTEALLDRMSRALIYLEHGRAAFTQAAKLPAFDSVADFAKLPEDARAMLQRIFPAKTIAGLEYTADELLAVEVFRNFAYPMRDWSAQLQFLGKASARNSVRLAQKAYSAKLAVIAQELKAGTITAEQASLRVQGAVAEFSVESKLTDYYRAHAREILRKTTPGNRYEESEELDELDELEEMESAEAA